MQTLLHLVHLRERGSITLVPIYLVPSEAEQFYFIWKMPAFYPVLSSILGVQQRTEKVKSLLISLRVPSHLGRCIFCLYLCFPNIKQLKGLVKEHGTEAGDIWRAPMGSLTSWESSQRETQKSGSIRKTLQALGPGRILNFQGKRQEMVWGRKWEQAKGHPKCGENLFYFPPRVTEKKILKASNQRRELHHI